MHKSVQLILILLFASCSSAMAHILDIDTSNMKDGELAFHFVKLGFYHILPYGLDHILFILGIFFLNSNLKTVLWQSTAFTVAHSITLGLTVLGKISVSEDIVEPLIAFSIAFVAVENLISDKPNALRFILIFLFGLLHGMGFALALSESGLPKDAFTSSLICFNVGVELGQVAVILGAYFLVAKWFSHKRWYRKVIVFPISIGIALIAIYWTLERIHLI
jgi:hypothetical protein